MCCSLISMCAAWVHTRALGKPTHTLLHVQGPPPRDRGDNLAVGTSHEGLHSSLYPTAYCQGGGLSTMWNQGHPICLPACPMEGLRVLLGLPILVCFVCFAGCEEAMLFSGGSCCSLWAWVQIQGGAEEQGKQDTQWGPHGERTLGFVVHYQVTP